MMKSAIGVGDDVGDLVGEIDAVRAKGISAHQELERLEQVRLSAETFEAAEAANARIARVSWETDRLAAMIPELESRLAIARNSKQKAAISRHAAANRKAWPKFRAAILGAVEAQEEMIKMREDAGKEIGEHAVTLNLPVQAFAGFLHRDHFGIWDAELSRVTAEPVAKPAVAAVVQSRVAPTPTRPVGVADRREVAKPVAPVPKVEPVKPKRQPRRDKIAVNSKLVTVLRSGIETPEGEQAAVGDVIGTFTMEQVDGLLRNGAVDLASANT
jgi:hypothetical protein